MFTGQLTGNLGRDPELKYFESGQIVATLSVAVRQRKRRGEDPPAYWVKVEVWGKTAEWVADNLRKGDSVTCYGEVALEEFTRRDGTPGVAQKLSSAQVERHGSRQESPAPGVNAYAAASQPAARPAPAPAAAPAPAPAPQQYDEQEIPF